MFAFLEWTLDPAKTHRYLNVNKNKLVIRTAILACFVMVANASAENTDATLRSEKNETPPISGWWHEEVPDVISNGKLLLDVRTRFEYADQSGKRDSHASTVRTRMGYETAPISGFRGMVEFEDISIIGNENNFNQAGLNPSAGDRTVIADPEQTEINRAWISYSNRDTVAKLGRQRIILDNARFIGNVGWRQNEQTFDGFSIKNQGLENFTLYYSYIYNVNRIFGDDHPGGNFDSRTHLFQTAYKGFSFGTITGYAYLVDLESGSAKPSSDTFGVSFNGARPLSEDTQVQYRAEFAWQQDAGNNPLDYDTEYYHLQLSGSKKHYKAGVGYESLGSNNGVGFATPLATLHAFNGWADVFLSTPGTGLRDLYFWAGLSLPNKIPLKFVYHNFRSETGGIDLGTEWDVVASKKIGKHWTALVKYANYNGGLADRQKFWAQLGFKY